MDDAFDAKSQAFTAWLLSHDGSFINPNVALKDFRPQGRGRGAGMTRPNYCSRSCMGVLV